MQNKQLSAKKRFNKTLTTPDNLELIDVFVPEVPKDIIFPDQLNRYLRDQVQYLIHENGMLQKNLSDVEIQLSDSTVKLNQVNSQLEEYHGVCPKNSFADCTPANLASGKIVELSKKLRERNSEIEVYKSKCSKLEQHIFNIEKKSETKEAPVVEVSRPKNELECQIKQLQEKLSNTTNKLFETRNANLQLKNDVKVATRLLQQEVGESLETVQTIVNKHKNWRGRAQIICDLQQKNNDLKEKLKASQYDEKPGPKVDTVQLTRLDKKLSEVSRENCELKASFGDVKKKLEASKARNKAVESECAVLRSKIRTLDEANDRNGDLITILKAKVAKAQDIQSEAVQEKEKIIQKQNLENRNLVIEVSKQTCKIDNHQFQINELKRELEIQKDKVKRGTVSSAKNAEMDTKTARQYEAERLRLLELTKIANERLESERVSHETTLSKFRIERQRVAKLEAKVARMEFDQRADQVSNYSSYSVKSSSKSDTNSEDRLQLAEETIKALQTRLEMERQEHKNDIQQFSRILNNCSYTANSNQEFTELGTTK